MSSNQTTGCKDFKCAECAKRNPAIFVLKPCEACKAILYGLNLGESDGDSEDESEDDDDDPQELLCEHYEEFVKRRQPVGTHRTVVLRPNMGKPVLTNVNFSSSKAEGAIDLKTLLGVTKDDKVMTWMVDYKAEHRVGPNDRPSANLKIHARVDRFSDLAKKLDLSLYHTAKAIGQAVWNHLDGTVVISAYKKSAKRYGDVTLDQLFWAEEVASLRAPPRIHVPVPVPTIQGVIIQCCKTTDEYWPRYFCVKKVEGNSNLRGHSGNREGIVSPISKKLGLPLRIKALADHVEKEDLFSPILELMRNMNRGRDQTVVPYGSYPVEWKNTASAIVVRDDDKNLTVDAVHAMVFFIEVEWAPLVTSVFHAQMQLQRKDPGASEAKLLEAIQRAEGFLTPENYAKTFGSLGLDRPAV